MLRLQQNMHDPFDTFYATERWALKFRAFLVALAAYVVLCLFLFAKSWLPGTMPTVMVRNNAAPVLFLSNNSKKGRGVSGDRKHGASNAALASTKKKGAKVEPKKTKPPVQKKIKAPQQKPKQKVEEKKTVKGGDAARKKIAPPAPPKKLEKKSDVKKEEKKIEPLPDKSIEKKEELPVIEKIEEKEVEVVEEKVIEEPQDVFVGQEIVGDESSYDATTKAHMALSRAVARTWRPPRVQVKKQVRVIAEVDGAGSVLDAVLEQKSDVVVYDIAARAAVLRAEFPREFWGKKVAIVFGN